MAHCISFIWDRSFFYTCKQLWCECENLYGASVIETNVHNTHRLCGQSEDASNVERKTITAFNRRIDPNQMFRLFTINIMDTQTQTQQQKLPTKNTIKQSQTNKITQTISERSRKYIDNMIYQFQSQFHFISIANQKSKCIRTGFFILFRMLFSRFPLRILTYSARKNYSRIYSVCQNICQNMKYNFGYSTPKYSFYFYFLLFCFIHFCIRCKCQTDFEFKSFCDHMLCVKLLQFFDFICVLTAVIVVTWYCYIWMVFRIFYVVISWIFSQTSCRFMEDLDK